jgi:hypothetical protein
VILSYKACSEEVVQDFVRISTGQTTNPPGVRISISPLGSLMETKSPFKRPLTRFFRETRLPWRVVSNNRSISNSSKGGQ